MYQTQPISDITRTVSKELMLMKTSEIRDT